VERFRQSQVFLQRALGVIAILLLLAQDVNIQQSTGIAIGGPKNARKAGFGNVNGLGINPVAGAIIVPTTGGVLYTTAINLAVNGAGNGNPAIVGVRIGNNFSVASGMQAFSCMSGCGSASGYTAISVNPASQTNDTPVIPSPGVTNNPTVTVFIGVFVSSQNGSPFNGTDSVQLVYDTYNGSNGQLKNTDTITLNNPSENVQTAVQLTLASNGGLAISPSNNYAVNFGNVNGLGIGAANFVPVTGGVIYYTPYLINPQFSNFSVGAGTIQVVTLGFPVANKTSTVLLLEDSSSSSGPFTPITAAPLTITSTAASTATPGNNAITRYLGLFVSNANNTNGTGVTAFTGSDTATITFTMTVR
jgi:hypothetical protein